MNVHSTVTLAVAMWLVASTGCGFQLRGGASDIPDPGQIYVDAASDVSVGEGVSRALKARGLSIVDTRSDADVLLRLTDERIDERILSVQSKGQVSELELSHSVDMLISRADEGEPTSPAAEPNRVDVIREYTYNRLGVLGKAEEARILREEMRDELVRQIVLRATASLDAVVQRGTAPLTGTQ